MALTFNHQQYGDLLPRYQPKLIRDEAENEAALAVIEELMHRGQRSVEEDELYDLRILLVEKFEHDFYQPGAKSTPTSMLNFLIQEQGVQVSDLVKVTGLEVQVQDILVGRLKMSVSQAKEFEHLFGVNVRVFV